jgi:uncharacterized membrane protein YraQ (UPF0718 family)
VSPRGEEAAAPPPARRPRRKVVDRSLVILSALALSGMIGVLATEGPGAVAEVIGQDLGLLLKVAPKVAAGVLIATLLPLFLDSAALNRLVGPERGWTGLAVAAGFGAAAPGGPSVVLPIAAGLFAAGADRGAGAAFVTGWVLLGINRTLVWELSFLPPELVWARILICLPAPLLVGWAARRMAPA